MTGSTRFVLNRAAVREQLLLSNGDIQVEQAIVAAAQEAAPDGCTVEVSRSYGQGGRVRVRIVDTSPDAVDTDMKTGKLQQALNSVHV